MSFSESEENLPGNRPNYDLDFEKAAQTGDIKRIVDILATGADVDGTGNLALTPLMQAIWSEQYKAAKLLIDRGADVHRTDIAGYNCFSIAAEKKDPAYLELLFNHCDKSCLDFSTEHNPLFIAAKANHARHVQACIKAGIDINAKDDSNWTPLHHAFLNNAHDVMKVLFEANVKIPPYFQAFAGLINKDETYDMIIRHLEKRTAQQTVRMSRLKRIKTPGFRA